MAAQGAHQRLLGEQRGGFHAGSHADTDEQRGAGVQTVAGHLVQDELGHALVAHARHQHHRLARQRATAACHVGIDFAVVVIGYDVPENGGRTLADVALGVHFVEGFHAVVAQGCGEGSADDGLLQQSLQLTHQREVDAALYPELQHTGVLAAGAVQGNSQLLVARHRVIDGGCQRGGLLLTQLLQLSLDIVGQLLADIGDEFRHLVGHEFNTLFFGHDWMPPM